MGCGGGPRSRCLLLLALSLSCARALDAPAPAPTAPRESRPNPLLRGLRSAVLPPLKAFAQSPPITRSWVSVSVLMAVLTSTRAIDARIVCFSEPDVVHKGEWWRLLLNFFFMGGTHSPPSGTHARHTHPARPAGQCNASATRVACAGHGTPLPDRAQPISLPHSLARRRQMRSSRFSSGSNCTTSGSAARCSSSSSTDGSRGISSS